MAQGRFVVPARQKQFVQLSGQLRPVALLGILMLNDCAHRLRQFLIALSSLECSGLQCFGLHLQLLQRCTACRLLSEPFDKQLNHFLLGFDLLLQNIESIVLIGRGGCSGCNLLALKTCDLFRKNGHVPVEGGVRVGEDLVRGSAADRNRQPFGHRHGV